MLDAIGVDPERDNATAALELDAVEHQHRQAQVAERATHELDLVLTRARHDLAADRRLRGRACDMVDLIADRLTRPRVAARAHAGQHPFEHHIAEPVARREVRIALQLDLVLAVRRSGARPADRHAPPSERDLTGLMAVAHRSAIRVVAALWADDLVDL